jgi:hypothetical protein
MHPRALKTVVLWTLTATCCVLTLLSCDRSPLAPRGLLLVYVSENGDGPAPGKRIEIPATSASQITDANGMARFDLRAGSYIVRAYDITTPGPGRPYVEQSVEIKSAQVSRTEFYDCTMCR